VLALLCRIHIQSWCNHGNGWDRKKCLACKTKIGQLWQGHRQL